MRSETPIVQTTILLVEEDADTRTRIASSIGAAGFQVIEVSRAEEALILLRTKQQVGLLFSSVSSGGPMDGLQLAVEVHRTWPELPILLTSALVTFRQSALPRRSRFLRKPYAAADVIKCIDQLTKAAL